MRFKNKCPSDWRIVEEGTVIVFHNQTLNIVGSSEYLSKVIIMIKYGIMLNSLSLIVEN